VKFRKLVFAEKTALVNHMGGFHKNPLMCLMATGQLATMWGK